VQRDKAPEQPHTNPASNHPADDIEIGTWQMVFFEKRIEFATLGGLFSEVSS
jgi:hypothetical protein